MCDCYAHKCECCEELIQMHIADSKYPKSDFKVWCEKHIEKASAGAIIFEVIESGDDFYDEPIGWKCAISGPDVGCDKGNAPNLSAEMKCEEIEAGAQ